MSAKPCRAARPAPSARALPLRRPERSVDRRSCRHGRFRHAFAWGCRHPFRRRGRQHRFLEGRGFDLKSEAPVTLDSLLPLPIEPDARWLARRAATEVTYDAGLRFLYVTAAGVAIGLAAGAVAVVFLRLVREGRVLGLEQQADVHRRIAGVVEARLPLQEAAAGRPRESGSAW